MKHSMFILLAAALLFSCNSNSQSKAMEQQKQAQEVLKQTTPGSVPTSANGYFMKAKINGKNWEANSMLPPEIPSRIIGYYNGESISLPYDRRYMVVGKKIDFKSHAVDLFQNDDVAIWGGHEGEMIITKVDGKSAEGSFHFIASSSGTNKTIEVTEGSFRILFK